MLRSRLFSSVLLLVVTSAVADSATGTADDWELEPRADVPPPILLSTGLTHDQQDNQTLSIGLSLPLNRKLDLGLWWDKSRLEGTDGHFDSDDLYSELSLQLDNGATLHGGYRYQGQSGELEIQRWQLGLSLDVKPLILRLDLGSGAATFYARDDLPPNWRIASSRDIDANYWSLRLDGDALDGGWFFQWSEYDYERDLSRLGSSALLQLIVAPGALEQAGLLLQRQTRLGWVGDFGISRYSLQWSRSQNAVDDAISGSLSLDLSHPLSEQLAVSLGVGHVVDSNQPWSVSLGLEWIAN